MPSKFEIRVENSAPSQRIPAKSLEFLKQHLDGSKAKSVVDYGFGRLRNVETLLQLTNDLTIVDIPEQVLRMKEEIPPGLRRKVYTPNDFFSLKKRYEVIVCIAVLHIIPIPSLRKNILEQLNLKLNPRGVLMLDVPIHESYYSDESKFERHNDGILLGTGKTRTFRKNFDSEELDDLVFSVFSSSRVKRIPGHSNRVFFCSQV